MDAGCRTSNDFAWQSNPHDHAQVVVAQAVPVAPTITLTRLPPVDEV